MKINKLYQTVKVFFKLVGLNHRIDDYFRLEDFTQTLGLFHFDSRWASESDKRSFFKNQLKEIELETHAFCNRKCVFCPNVSIDRTDKGQVLPEDVFKRLIGELSDIDYKGSIKFHRFNEPLGLDIIFDRVMYAREKVPRALLGFHSNGDYVTYETLKKFEDIGMNFLHISLYIDFNIARSMMRKEAHRQSRIYLEKRSLKGRSVKSYGNLAKYIIPMKQMEVYIFVPDIKGVVGNDRGGYLKDLQQNKIRTSPCRSPFRGLYIDWTGDVLPCCNLRGDIESQKGYIMGNIKTSPLQDILLSEVSNNIRRMLVDYSDKEGVCKYCNYDLFHAGRRFKRVIADRVKALKVMGELRGGKGLHRADSLKAGFLLASG